MSAVEILKKIGILKPTDILAEGAALAEIKAAFRNQRFLDCLDRVGVDNWEGYADAMELYEEEE